MDPNVQPPAPPQHYLQPYPQQYPQQPGYGQPTTTYVTATFPAPQPKGLSITAMILGIASFVFGFTFLVPVAAIIFGIIGRSREPAGRGMATTGIVLGIVCLVFNLLMSILFFGAFAALIGMSTGV
ncbi:hypothetical protein GCM10022198_23150 [Klugiella xanthotipulae]|uniref:Uncharacterized protein DUF4190 n=1 Tax=Klugiella xanthotipulae TaxID=244735 RepID=A0A543I5V3_9MICO|nr:DUF4190 domain-containing protein [Klugiella xanthotipulae]TQM65957.1 uncharacterized protein DUF4190 [Klugiella xanthotipulae]